MTLRPTIVGGLAALTVGTASILTLVNSPASADTGRCVTKTEYRKIHMGMTKTRVHRIFDTRGWLADGGAGGYSRVYRSCDHQHAAYVEYAKGPGKPARMDGWKRWRLCPCD